jgi:hypothetical protein
VDEGTGQRQQFVIRIFEGGRNQHGERYSRGASMVKSIMKDIFFLNQKSEPATKADDHLEGIII